MKIICDVIIIIMQWIIYYVCCTMFLKLRWSGMLGKLYYALYVCANLSVAQITDNSNITFMFELLMPLIFFKGKVIKKEIVYWVSILFTSLSLLVVNEIICKIMEISSMEIVEYRITARMVFVLSLVICYYAVSLIKIKIDNRLAVIGTQSLIHFLVLMIMLFAIICFLIQIYKYNLSEAVLAGIENATCGIFMLVLIINMISFEIFKSSIFQAKKYAEEKARLEMYELQRAHIA